MVLLEAMARGVAVVASDVPGPREIIDDGATGLLFTAGSAPELAQALAQLTQTAFRNRLGRAGRAFVEEERMTTAHSAARHAALYEHLLSASSLQR